MSTESNQEPNLEDVDAAQIAEDLVEAVESVDFEQATTELDSEVSQLQSKLAEMEKEALRHQADLENFRKRSRAQMQEEKKYASLPLITDLLESVDNLNRAADSAKGEGSDSSIVEGVKMVAQQINTILENHGCKKIEAIGQPFDPNCHQAIQMQPSDEFEANTVMAEARSGFMLHERVIRPAQVFVSTGPHKED